MKNGFFRPATWFFALAILSLNSCASLSSLLEADNPADYDRGYAAEGEEDDSQPCRGRYCDSAEAEEEEDGRAPASLSSADRRRQRAIHSRDVILGMTRQDVLESWGTPRQREVAGRGANGNERWTYGTRYSLDGARTVIFENGRVAGWER